VYAAAAAHPSRLLGSGCCQSPSSGLRPVGAIKPTSSPAAGAAMSVSNLWNSGPAGQQRETSDRERPVLLARAGSNRPEEVIRSNHSKPDTRAPSSVARE
jgi:hypothetical protein